MRRERVDYLRAKLDTGRLPRSPGRLPPEWWPDWSGALAAFSPERWPDWPGTTIHLPWHRHRTVVLPGKPRNSGLRGTLTAPRVLCHLGDQLRVSLGDAPSRPTHNLLTRTLLKHLVVNTARNAPRGRIKTAPEMLLAAPTSWDADLEACVALIEPVGRGEAHAVHPTDQPRNWSWTPFGSRTSSDHAAVPEGG